MTHLLFADDSLLFCRAEAYVCKLEFSELMRKLQGNRLIWRSHQFFFSPCVSDVKRERLMNELGIGVVMRGERYLGLPMILGLSKKDFFGSVVEKIGKRAVSNFQIGLSRRSEDWFPISGGGKGNKKERCIGWLGANCANLKVMAEWGLETLCNSIKPS